MGSTKRVQSVEEPEFCARFSSILAVLRYEGTRVRVWIEGFVWSNELGIVNWFDQRLWCFEKGA